MLDRPYFLWDVNISEAELRERLRHPDPAIRAQWQGRVLREARYPDVWLYLTLDEVLRDWQHLERHLGRKRAFWRWLIEGWRKDGGNETCVIDLVIDRAPAIDEQKSSFGSVRVDTLREITANKLCAVVGRSEAKDLVDLMVLQRAGADLMQGVADALVKDASADPATIAWVLDQIAIGPDALLPGEVDADTLERFRVRLVAALRAAAFPSTH